MTHLHFSWSELVQNTQQAIIIDFKVIFAKKNDQFALLAM